MNETECDTYCHECEHICPHSWRRVSIDYAVWACDVCGTVSEGEVIDDDD